MATISIPLNQGKYALIDEDDFALVSQYNWFLQGLGPYHSYAIRNLPIGSDKKIESMHRFLMNAADDIEVDHINGDGLDNRRQNLRLATRSQNMANQKKKEGTTSRYKGVSWRKVERKWRAYIKCDKQNRHLGYFHSEIEAALAYDRAARELFGKFANLNFPDV
jgi:hypothetical protein